MIVLWKNKVLKRKLKKNSQGSLWIVLELSSIFFQNFLGIFSILRPLNNILLVSYDFLEFLRVLKQKVKKVCVRDIFKKYFCTL